MDRNDPPIPDRTKLTEALARAHAGLVALRSGDLEELVEAAGWALHQLPDEGGDFMDLVTRNPITQVYFRAGLLAAREQAARLIDSEDRACASMVRAMWWLDQFGPDPGPPRRFSFDEVAEEVEHPDGRVEYKSRDISATIEALPRALAFLMLVGAITPEELETMEAAK